MDHDGREEIQHRLVEFNVLRDVKNCVDRKICNVTMFMLIECKLKKLIISTLTFGQISGKGYHSLHKDTLCQNANFLVLIRSCVSLVYMCNTKISYANNTHTVVLD